MSWTSKASSTGWTVDNRMGMRQFAQHILVAMGIVGLCNLWVRGTLSGEVPAARERELLRYYPAKNYAMPTTRGGFAGGDADEQAKESKRSAAMSCGRGAAYSSATVSASSWPYEQIRSYHPSAALRTANDSVEDLLNPDSGSSTPNKGVAIKVTPFARTGTRGGRGRGRGTGTMSFRGGGYRLFNNKSASSGLPTRNADHIVFIPNKEFIDMLWSPLIDLDIIDHNLVNFDGWGVASWRDGINAAAAIQMAEAAAAKREETESKSSSGDGDADAMQSGKSLAKPSYKRGTKGTAKNLKAQGLSKVVEVNGKKGFLHEREEPSLTNEHRMVGSILMQWPLVKNGNKNWARLQATSAYLEKTLKDQLRAQLKHKGGFTEFCRSQNVFFGVKKELGKHIIYLKEISVVLLQQRHYKIKEAEKKLINERSSAKMSHFFKDGPRSTPPRGGSSLLGNTAQPEEESGGVSAVTRNSRSSRRSTYKSDETAALPASNSEGASSVSSAYVKRIAKSKKATKVAITPPEPSAYTESEQALLQALFKELGIEVEPEAPVAAAAPPPTFKLGDVATWGDPTNTSHWVASPEVIGAALEARGVAPTDPNYTRIVYAWKKYDELMSKIVIQQALTALKIQ